MTDAGEVGEDVALLLPQGVRGRHDTGGKAGAPVALGAEGFLPPEHKRPQFTLTVIVGRLDTGDMRECPEGATGARECPRTIR